MVKIAMGGFAALNFLHIHRLNDKHEQVTAIAA